MIRSRTTVGIVLFIASVAAAEPKAITVWDSLPKGYSVYAEAADAESLAALVKPQVRYFNGNYDEMFVWSDKDADGQRWFALATARMIVANGKSSWVLAKAEAGAKATPDQTMPLSRAKVEKGPGVFGDLRVHVASMHRTKGTVYQIDVPWSDELSTHEDRVFIMHDPRNGWRLAAVCRGDAAWNWGTDEVSTDLTWTDDDRRPLRISYVCRETPKPTKVLTAPVAVYEESVREGDLPMYYPKVTSHYVLVAEGDTYTTLTARFIGWRCYGRQPTPAELTAWRDKIRSLNVDLQPDKLRVGTKLIVPGP